MAQSDLSALRVWLDRWCWAAQDSRYDAARFTREMEEHAPGDVLQVRIVPQDFAIEYVGSSGQSSTRSVRIHTMGLSTRGGGLLQGYCYWRKARRTFRMDRLVSVIDQDGELHAPPAMFVRNVFNTYAVASDTERQAGAYAAFVDGYSSHFVLLRIMAGIDGEVAPEELAVIGDYAARLMLRSDDALDEETVAQLLKWVRRLRPEAGDLEDALIVLEARSAREVQDLLRAAKSVLEADGRHDARELDLLDELCIALAE